MFYSQNFPIKIRKRLFKYEPCRCQQFNNLTVYFRKNGVELTICQNCPHFHELWTQLQSMARMNNDQRKEKHNTLSDCDMPWSVLFEYKMHNEPTYANWDKINLFIWRGFFSYYTRDFHVADGKLTRTHKKLRVDNVMLWAIAFHIFL